MSVGAVKCTSDFWVASRPFVVGLACIRLLLAYLHVQAERYASQDEKIREIL